MLLWIFLQGEWWVSPHYGCPSDFMCGKIKPCFILCKYALKYLLSIGNMWHVHEWLKYNEICDCLWGSLAPSMHTFFCNAVVHEQYVHYTLRSLPLKQLVTLTHLSPLITTSAQDSHPLWTHLGIQISCLSSTTLNVLSLSKACTKAVPMTLTTSTHFTYKNLMTPRTSTSDHIPTWHVLFRPNKYVSITFVVLMKCYRMINTIHVCQENVKLSGRWFFNTWYVLVPTFCSNDILQ